LVIRCTGGAATTVAWGGSSLHAWRLSLNLPQAGPRTFVAPLAPDLLRYLDALGVADDIAEPYGAIR